MSVVAAKSEVEEKYTYADYYSWGEDAERCELIDGVIYAMSAPTRTHQYTALSLGSELRNFFLGRRCTPYIAPIDVRLNPTGFDDTVVQPDIVVLCDPKKFSDGKTIQGAPDLVIEVLSKSTAKHDRLRKFKKYEQAGVREYWLVNPSYASIEVFILEDNKFVFFEEFDIKDGVVKSHIFDDMEIKLNNIFESQDDIF
jgi:Uma2 family endonuclease